MRILQANTKRPLNVLAVGAGGHVAAASSLFGAGGDVDVWDIATGKVAFSLVRFRSPSFAFSLDGTRLFVGMERAVAVRGIPNGELVARHEIANYDPGLAVSADGTRLLVAASEGFDGDLTCYAMETEAAFRQPWAVGKKRWLYYDKPAFAPDGKRFAVAMHDGSRDRARNNVQIRDSATGKVTAEIEFGASDPLEQIVFSADGSKVLARSSGRVVKVFDSATGAPDGELTHPGRPFVTGVAVHPNGTVACSRNSGAVCFWDLGRRELVRSLDWKLGKLVSVAFSPDGSIGAVGTEDGRVVVWDVDE